MSEVEKPNASAEEGDRDRRDFLKAAGKFAAIVPPAMTFLLSTSMTASASGRSGGTAVSGAHSQNRQANSQNGSSDGYGHGGSSDRRHRRRRGHS